MPETSLITLFVRPLNDAGIAYLVTGGVASIVYGEPRFTRGIDLVLALGPTQADAFSGLWPAAEFYVPPVEVIAEEAGRPEHGHFNLVHHETGLRADCYVVGTDPLHEWALGRPQVEQVGADQVRLAPIEYVILRKLHYYRAGGSDRHLRDVASMLRVSGETIDRTALDDWLRRLGLEEAWARAAAWNEAP